MLYLCCYDIEPDGVRQRLAQTLLDAGMDRVQRSVFIGKLSDARRVALLQRTEALLGNHPNVHMMLLPLLNRRIHDYQYVGTVPPDWDYLASERHTLMI